MKKSPSAISVLILVVFLVILLGKPEAISEDYRCNRIFNGVYNWNIFTPIYFILLIFSLYELWGIRNKMRENLLSSIFLFSVPGYIIFSLVRRLVFG